MFEDFFVCKYVLAANHLYPENNQRFFRLKIVLDANHHYPENIQTLFRLQNCLRRKSSLIRKYSMTFSPAKWSWPQIIFILETFNDFSPAKLSRMQIIIILKLFTEFFACKIVSDANHHYPEIIERIFLLQNCLNRKSFLS